MSTNFSIKRQIFVFFYWDWLCLLEGNKIHCGGRRDHKNSLCSEEKISLEFYSLQTFRVVLMVGILQSNWWNELLKNFFIPFSLAFHHTSSPQEVGTCPQATYPPPTDRYEPSGYTPSPNRPVRAPGLALLQETGTSSLGVPPPLPQQTGTSPQATHPLPTDRYVPPG